MYSTFKIVDSIATTVLAKIFKGRTVYFATINCF